MRDNYDIDCTFHVDAERCQECTKYDCCYEHWLEDVDHDIHGGEA